MGHQECVCGVFAQGPSGLLEPVSRVGPPIHGYEPEDRQATLKSSSLAMIIWIIHMIMATDTDSASPDSWTLVEAVRTRVRVRLGPEVGSGSVRS